MKRAILFVILFCSSAFGQAICESLLKAANYNQIQTVNQTQHSSVNKANFCIAEYDRASTEQKAQVEVSYKVFSGGASGSATEIKERQRMECGSQYGETWFQQLGLMNQRIVSDKAMDTVSSCIKAHAAGLIVEPTFTSDEKAVHITVTWKRSQPLPIRNLIISPANEVSCTLDGTSTNATGVFSGRSLQPSQSIMFACTRTVSEKQSAGEKTSCVDNALITVDVQETPFTLNLFRRCDGDVSLTRAEQLKADLAKLTLRLKDLESSSVRYGDGVHLQTYEKLYLGVSGGKGVVNTGTPGLPDRTGKGSDERLVILK